MKRYIGLWIFALCIMFLSGCSQNQLTPTIDEDTSITQNPDIKDILEVIIKNHSSCDDNSETFVDFAILWTWINDNWNTEYYIVANWQCFYIDERWNLNNSGWFWSLPTTIELFENENWYNLIRYETAKDWSEYDSSTMKMFSKKAYKTRKDAKYYFLNDKSLLNQAEEYFWITIIPEWENNFDCSFCDKVRYYEPNYEDLNSNELIFNYTSIDNWNNTIYFNSDWSFEAKWSWDAWTWTRVFWQNENTIIIENQNLMHIYDRYIITSQTEDYLSTILEIIQRR